MIRIVRFLEPLPPCQHNLFVESRAPARENLLQFCTDLDVSNPMARVDSTAVGDFGQLLLGTEEIQGPAPVSADRDHQRIELLSQTDQQLLRNLWIQRLLPHRQQTYPPLLWQITCYVVTTS